MGPDPLAQLGLSGEGAAKGGPDGQPIQAQLVAAQPEAERLVQAGLCGDVAPAGAGGAGAES